MNSLKRLGETLGETTVILIKKHKAFLAGGAECTDIRKSNKFFFNYATNAPKFLFGEKRLGFPNDFACTC